MKFALHSVLRPGQEATYEQAHATIPVEVLASLGEAGVTDWTIWRSGEDLFHVVDCQDFDATMTVLADDPRNHRWQEQMRTYVSHVVEVDGVPELSHVWTMSDQLATTPADAGEAL